MPAFQVIASPFPTPLTALVASLPALSDSHWLALPSERQASTARAAAKITVDSKENETSPILTIRAVPIRLLKSWGQYRAPVSPTFRRLVVRQCVARLVRPEDYFGRVRETAGFPPALAELLRELKQACVDPEMLHGVCGELTSSYVSQKTGEIANLYAAVETQLAAAEEVDEDDLIRSVAGRLEEGERHGLPGMLDVAGFYQFTTAQLLLLHSMAGAGVTVRVHLLEDSSRPLLFAATTRTRLRLVELDAEVINTPSPPSLNPSTPPPFHPPILHHLERSVFTQEPIDAEGGAEITVLEAPGDYVEGEMIALRIRQLHDDSAVPYGEMAVVVRSVGQHAARLRSIMHRFEVPFTASTLEPLADNPAVQFLIRLFELLCSEWPRANLLRALRSSYLGLDLEAADRLERAARREGVLEGQEAFIELASKVGSRPLVSFLRRLQGWQGELASPVPPRDQAARLRRWAMSCLWGRARRPAADLEGFPSPTEEVESGTELLEGDAPALRMAYRVANEMVRAAVHAAGTGNRGSFDETAIPSVDFIEELLALWRSATYSLPRGKDDRVLLLDAYDVTPREFRVVFVAGLLEGLFPRRPAEDPFFRDGERSALAAAGVRLSTSLESADEEKLLFYRAVSAARDQLFLTYPRVSGEGREVLRSFYVDEVAAVLGDLGDRTHSRTLANVAPEPHEALSERDRACAVAVAAGDWRRPADREFIQRCRSYQDLHRTEANLLFRLRDNAHRPAPFRLESGWGPGGDPRSFGV
ncbi:MAG: hypothetical protein M3Y56_03975, partial [Armatimonadota bacterium]|nr:hypothetical protein [Armatimonadota bacterium]